MATWYRRRGLGLLLAAGIAASTGMLPLTAGPLPGWPVVYGGPGESTDVARATAVDTAGNVYVTGTSADDIVTLKYNAAGQLLWSRRYAGPAGGLDSPAGIVVDEAGRVYVAGSSYGGFVPLGGSDFDMLALAYAADGTERWVYRWDGPGGREDAATALFRDADGNLRLGGYAWAGVAGLDFAAWKLSPDGELLHTQQFDGAGDTDRALSAALGEDGAFYLTGESRSAATDLDYLTVRLSPTGTVEWSARYDNGTGASDAATAVAARDGNVWVTGVSAGNGGEDCVTLQYSASGVHQWTHRFDGPLYGRDGGLAVRAAAGGKAFVGGYLAGAGGEPDLLLLKLDGDGSLAWSRTFAGPGGKADRARALVLDEGDGVAVTGAYSAAGSAQGCVVLRYGAGGVKRSDDRYLGATATPTGGLDLHRSATGTVTAVASTWSTNGSLDYVTLRFTPPAAAPPAPPSQFSATYRDGGVDLQWLDTNSLEAGYRVERAEIGSAFTPREDLPPGSTTYRDTEITVGHHYSYRVRAVNEAGQSAPSGVARVQVPVPAAGKLVVKPARLNFGKVRLGRTVVRKLTVRNLGRGTLQVGANVEGTGLTLVSPVGPIELLPRKRATFRVSFTPGPKGAIQGKVLFESNDPVRPTLEVPVRGKVR